MLKATTKRSLFPAFVRSICSRPFFQLTVLCALGCLAEGRPKTMKRCGRRDPRMEKIIGGKEVNLGQFPWMVSVHEKNYYFKHVCGGAILNQYYIVTAAHCIDYPKKPGNYEIYVGLHRLSKNTKKPTQKHKISKVILHKDFDAKTFANDIALLRTKTPIQTEGTAGYVNGICLPYTDRDPTGWGVIAGWGHTEEDGKNSDVLLSVGVPLVSRKECYKAYDEDPEDDSDDVLDSQICAGKVNRDSCQNDSGGPLMQKDKKGIYTLIGIVSYGTGCGDRKYPGVYTKVASYLKWLEKHME